jgi:hypothetical protein
MAQAMGALHKRFTEVAIMANSTDDFYRRVTIFGGFRFLPPDFPPSKKINSTIIRDYFQLQELYVSRIVDLTLDRFWSTFEENSNTYSKNTQIVFAAFILTVFFVFIILARRMLEQL